MRGIENVSARMTSPTRFGTEIWDKLVSHISPSSTGSARSIQTSLETVIGIAVLENPSARK